MDHFDVSAILPWEWDSIIRTIKERSKDIQDEIIQYVVAGGVGYETTGVVESLLVCFPDDKRLVAKRSDVSLRRNCKRRRRLV
jgi:hypothetical protein